jgi:cation diffusion facilitator family transporter
MSAPQNHAQEKQKVAAFSLLASAVMAIAKFAAAFFSGSLGLLSEAFQTLLDVLATTLTLFAVRVSDKPADDEHHYGHAKVENIAALLQTVMLFGVAVYVAFEAISRLFAGDHEIKLQWWLYAVVIGSILIDYNRYRALKRTAVKTGSAALAADAVHFAADMWSSLAVLLGLILVWFGFTYADSVAALVVTGFVTHAAWELGKQTLNNLLDAAPAGAVAQITDVVDTVDGVLSIRQLRVRPAGPTLFVDLIVDVPRTLPVM